MNCSYNVWLLVLVFMTSSCISKNKGVCHYGIMKLFNWCEQSECADGCTCNSPNSVCKQICSKRKCEYLKCSSPTTCFQSSLSLNRRLKPQVDHMVSHSPINHQECNQGYCKRMQSKRYKLTTTRSFQSCSEGTCDVLSSESDYTKQFCGRCKNMQCGGEHARNCTQLCVLGECTNMVCNAKHCKQVCMHGSKCNLTCGSNVDVCKQTCGTASKCNMICEAKKCLQVCEESSLNCKTVNNETASHFNVAIPTTLTVETINENRKTSSMSTKIKISSDFMVLLSQLSLIITLRGS